MRWQKRLFDLGVGGVALLPVALLCVIIALLLVVSEGRPVLYASERMASPRRAFRLWKFRTMTGDGGLCVSGGHVAPRVTRTGAVLRRTRLDELPQLWNVLAGDMSLVGPRPPLRSVVERFPALYSAVLRTRPGVTGLASLCYHRHESRVLGGCRTATETERAYLRRCVPAKARLDLIYAARQTVLLDAAILTATLADRMLPAGGRAGSRLRRAAWRTAGRTTGQEKLWMKTIFGMLDGCRLTKNQATRTTLLI